MQARFLLLAQISRIARRNCPRAPERQENMTMARTYRIIAFALLAPIAVFAAPVSAQVVATDPDVMIDGDLAGGETNAPAGPVAAPAPSAGNGTPVDSAAPAASAGVDSWNAQDIAAPATTTAAVTGDAADASGSTYRQDDLMGAAEGVFGKGSEGLAAMIEDILKKQGEPNGYITGREAGGAIAVGLRYGSGTLHHKVEGNRPIYWTGPSLGFDLGLNAGKAFVLVYNLYDTQDIYHRFGAGEGQAYLVGGFHVSYLRRGDVVLIPVRMGAGLRLGANVGYMKISQKARWLPF